MPQRVAVISSSTAAGYGDFMAQLQNNPYRYQIKTSLFQSSMQGDKVEGDIISHLKTINRHANDYDIVVIIRGGGSKLDLEAFNSYHLAVAIAQCSLPVLTGIGHQQDETIADMVAHSALKTPTAVADTIINGFLQLENYINELTVRLHQGSNYLVQQEQQYLLNLQAKLSRSSSQLLVKQQINVELLQQKLASSSSQFLQKQQQRIAFVEQLTQLFQVDKLLKRGFSIVRYEGKSVNNSSDLPPNAHVNIQFYKGNLQAKIESENKK